MATIVKSWEYFAAMIDGEGHIGLHGLSTSRFKKPMLTIAQKDWCATEAKSIEGD